MNDFQRLNKELLYDALSIIKALLPLGRRKNNEWISLNPTRNDKSIGSFKVNIKTGKWADFATGDRGSDLISLYAHVKGLSQYEAFKAMSIK